MRKYLTFAFLGTLTFALPLLQANPPEASPPRPRYMTGAKPSPPQVLAAAPRFTPRGIGAPAQFARVPDRLSVWGNDRYGDCVTAEEAAAKIAAHPHVLVPDAEVIRWARAHGVLNGATLDEVLDAMRTDGLRADDGQVYTDGEKLLVNFRDRATLCSAIYQGPVKIAVASGQVMDAVNTTGGRTGWAATNWRRDPRTDHCVSLFGYGPASYLYDELAKKFPGVARPASVAPDEFGYLLFTWGTIGFVNERSLWNVTTEGWVRNPTTAGFPEPTPPPPAPPAPPEPPPPPPPAPPPAPPAPAPHWWDGLLAIWDYLVVFLAGLFGYPVGRSVLRRLARFAVPADNR